LTPGRGRAVSNAAPRGNADFPVQDPRQIVLQNVELGAPRAGIVVNELDKELDLFRRVWVVFQDRPVDPKLRDPHASAGLADPLQGEASGQAGVKLSNTHGEAPTALEVSARWRVDRMRAATSSYGSVASRKAQRPKPKVRVASGLEVGKGRRRFLLSCHQEVASGGVGSKGSSSSSRG